MIEMPSDARRPIEAQRHKGMSSEELRGRSSGVMVGAVFGLVWVGSALPALGAVVAVPVLVASVAIFAVLMTGSRRLRVAATAVPASASPAGGADLDKMPRRFTIVIVIEAVAIFATARILAESDHSQWIAAAVCMIVGLHFFPLARLFRFGLYHATAVTLLLVAGVTMLLGAAGTPPQLWQLLPGFGAALALWATGARLLLTSNNATETVRPRPVPG